ncbi:MAG TPA: hypothetical protein VFH61_12865, partial [Thermoleophilia bacterium]|nr:hypothetical protein [Thermoleophilia bacterium]
MADSVKLNIGPLEAYAKAIHYASPSGPIGGMLRKWGARYLAFTRRRFVAQSGGGGDWPDLAPATKLHRRGPKRRVKRGHGAKGAKTTT